MFAAMRVGCTLVYRPWPTSWLSPPDQFGRGNIIVQRLGHVDKADCLSLLASVCVWLNIACAGLCSFDLLFSKMWERLTRKKPSPLSWDMVAHWLRRLLSTGGSWVRLPL